MTVHGYRKLTERKAELEDLLQEAGERAGDAAGIERNWHDNAGYDQAIQEMDILQAQLADITAQLNTAEIIETTAGSDSVVIGSRVTVEIDGEQKTYLVGGEADSDPAKGIISYRSPIGAAVLRKHVGDETEAVTPSGTTYGCGSWASPDEKHREEVQPMTETEQEVYAEHRYLLIPRLMPPAMASVIAAAHPDDGDCRSYTSCGMGWGLGCESPAESWSGTAVVSWREACPATARRSPSCHGTGSLAAAA
jgi:transcription elongation factor GreA